MKAALADANERVNDALLLYVGAMVVVSICIHSAGSGGSYLNENWTASCS
jgi:hypothetical protein